MKTLQFVGKDFRKLGESFFENLQEEMKSSGIRMNPLSCDHLCYRVGTSEEYSRMKKELSQIAVLLTETSVNGRPISTYRLSEPFETSLGPIDLVELPSPKNGQFYETGFEHAEFVIRKSFQSIQRQNPKLQFSQSGSHFSNPELSLKLASGQIKFHPLPLDRVIEIEKASITDIVFDFDGTLIESKKQILQIDCLVLSEVCQRRVSIGDVTEKFSPDFETLFSNFGITCCQTKEYAVSLWSKLSGDFNFPLFDGTRDLLKSLAARNFRLHLWTARDSASATKLLKEHKIDLFFATKSFSENGKSKPNPSNLGLEWEQKPRNSLLMIGDSPSDIVGAKNIRAIAAAGMWDSNYDTQAMLAAGAELFFYKLSDLEEWISRAPQNS